MKIGWYGAALQHIATPQPHTCTYPPQIYNVIVSHSFGVIVHLFNASSHPLPYYIASCNGWMHEMYHKDLNHAPPARVLAENARTCNCSSWPEINTACSKTCNLLMDNYKTCICSHYAPLAPTQPQPILSLSLCSFLSLWRSFHI